MRIVLVGALNGAFAVAAGAFGAHLLGGRIADADAEIFHTAVTYQAIHAAAMVAMGALSAHVLRGFYVAASWAMGLGTVLFAGALYAVALSGVGAFATIAPIGGGLLIVGWLLLAVAAARAI